MRSLALLICAMFAFSPSGEAGVVKFQASGLRARVAGPRAVKSPEEVFGPGPNEICQEAYVREFAALQGIRSIPVNADYCELPATKVPHEVVEVLARIREIHTRYASAVGRSPGELFGMGVELSIGAGPAGPLGSATTRELDGSPNSVEIDVFKDFRAERFPDRIYAHELTHLLLIDGRLGTAARDLEPSYLFFESFPDLVSSYVTNSLRIDFTDPSIRPELTAARDGAPLQSMKRPFRDFYLGRFQREPLDLCASLPMKSMTPNERGMCKFLRADDAESRARGTLYSSAKELPPTEKQLAAVFQPERCLIHYKNGTKGLDACFKNALGPVLISFIHSIDSLLGDRPLVTLLNAIDEAGETPDHYTCNFTNSKVRAYHAASATISFGSVMRVFKLIRDGLDGAGQARFDEDWAAHGLDTWAKLERFDRETVVAPFAYQVLVKNNEAFSDEFRCESKTPSQRGPYCAARCSYRPGSVAVPALF